MSLGLIYQDQYVAEVERILREIVQKEGREMLHPEAVHCYEIWGSSVGSDCGPMGHVCVTFTKKKYNDKHKRYVLDCQTEVIVNPRREIVEIIVAKNIGYAPHAPEECFRH